MSGEVIAAPSRALMYTLAIVALLVAVVYAGTRRKTRRAASRPSRAPRTHFDLNNAADVTLLDEVRQQYAHLLARESGPYADCLFKPAALLPFPKQTIAAAMETLIEIAEGRQDSPFVSARLRTPEFAENVKACLVQLMDFLDVPASELPQEPNENARIGFRLGGGITGGAPGS